MDPAPSVKPASPARNSVLPWLRFVVALAGAKDAIRQNLGIPLGVAGFGEVAVAVRFDGEPAAP